MPPVGPTYQPNWETPGGAATVVSPALARRPASVVHAADHGRLALRGHGHPVA